MYQLYPKEDDPTPMNAGVTLIFFHGIPKVPKEWIMSWRTRDNKHLWPQMWLPGDLGGNTRVLSVSYYGRPNGIHEDALALFEILTNRYMSGSLAI